MIKDELRIKIKSLLDKGALHVIVGNFATKFVAFFASMFIVRLFSKAQYGVLGYVENLYSYVYLLAGFGLNNALFRYMVLAKGKSEERSVFSYVVKKSAIYNFFLVCLSSCFFIFVYSYKFDFLDAKWLLPIALLALPFQFLSETGITYYQATFKTKKYAYYSCVMSISVLVFKYVFSYLFSLRGAFVSNLLIYFVWAILLLIMIIKLYSNNGSTTKLTKNTRHEMDAYSFQYMITNSLWAIFMLNDVFLLGKYCDASIVAEYKVAYTLPANIAILSSSIAVFVAPYFVKHEDDKNWIRKNFVLNYLCAGALVGLAAVLIAIFARPLLLVLYGESYVNVAPLMRLLLIASFINNAVRVTSANLLAAMGKVKYNMISAGVGVSLQILINIYSIPKYGVYGVAYTSIFVYAVMALIVNVAFISTYFSKDKVKHKNN